MCGVAIDLIYNYLVELNLFSGRHITQQHCPYSKHNLSTHTPKLVLGLASSLALRVLRACCTITPVFMVILNHLICFCFFFFLCRILFGNNKNYINLNYILCACDMYKEEETIVSAHAKLYGSG